MDVWLCLDCTDYICNGEGEAPEGLENWNLSFNAGEDEEDGYQPFSYDGCPVCDSGLGGARYRFWSWD